MFNGIIDGAGFGNVRCCMASVFFARKNREKVNGMDPSIRRFARGWLGLKIVVSRNYGISTFEAILLGRSESSTRPLKAYYGLVVDPNPNT